MKRSKLRDRIRHFFRGKESRATREIIKGTSGVIWTPHDYENFANESYLRNIISFRCMDLIAKSVASVPWGMKKRLTSGETKVVPDHPLNRLLRRPNPDTSWTSLMIQTMCYLLISGNTFFERISPDTGPNQGTARELYTLRPDRIKILTDPVVGRLSGYQYTVGSNVTTWLKDRITGACDVMQMKTFHPTDDFWGASTTEPASYEIDTSNEATRWNKSVLQNEGRPGMVFVVGGYLTDEQYDRLEKQLNDTRSGADNARKNLIVEGEKASVTPYGWNPAELDFLEGSRELNRRIAFAYGVPPMLIGIPGDNTYSNYKEARMAFWEDTIVPYLNQIREELTYWLLGVDNPFFLDYDLNNISAFSLKREKTWQMAERSDFLMYNEKRKLAGFDERPDCDKVLVNSNMVPIEKAGEIQQNPFGAPGAPPPDGTPIDGNTPPKKPDKPKKEYEDLSMNEKDFYEILNDEGFSDKECLTAIEQAKELIKEIELTDESEYVACENKPFENEFSCRLKDPGQYEKFARVNNAGKVNGK